MNTLSSERMEQTEQFRKPLSSFIRPTCSTHFSIHHPVGIKLLVRLRLSFNHLREHKFRHSFHDTLNPLCSCSLKSETTLHYSLCCHNISSTRSVLMNVLNLIDPTIFHLNGSALANIFYTGIQRKVHSRLAEFCRVLSNTYVMLCAIRYHLHHFKNLKNTHGGVLLLVNLQAKASMSFFTFFRLYKWYQIAQSVSYLEQNDFMRHSPKGHTYIHSLYHIIFYISCILTICYMWCANGTYYSQTELV